MSITDERYSSTSLTAAYKLSDEELLQVLMDRGSALRTANAFAVLVRLYEHCGAVNPKLKAGLEAAIGLTKLYSQNFEPGHWKHPFKGFHSSVDKIVAQALDNENALPIVIPPPQQSVTVLKQRRPYPSVTGKVSAVSAEIMALPLQMFDRAQVLDALAEKMLKYGWNGSDISNAISALRTKGKISRIKWGWYKKINKASTEPQSAPNLTVEAPSDSIV